MEPASLLTFEATVEEWRAIWRMIDIYLYYLEATMLETAERALIIAELRSLQMRPRDSRDNIVTWQCPHAEARALGGAAICYTRLVAIAMPYSEGESVYKQLVMGFHKRYIGQLQPPGDDQNTHKGGTQP